MWASLIWDLLSWDPFISDHVHVRLVFSCDCFDQRKKTLHFSAINWNYCGASIKQTDRNARHNALSWSNNDISEVQRSLLNPRYEEFWPLRCFYVRVHLQPNVSHLGHGRAKPCKTSNEESPCKTSGLPQRSGRSIIKMWFAVNQNSFTLTWRKMNVVPNEKVSCECGLKRLGLTQWWWNHRKWPSYHQTCIRLWKFCCLASAFSA